MPGFGGQDGRKGTPGMMGLPGNTSLLDCYFLLKAVHHCKHNVLLTFIKKNTHLSNNFFFFVFCLFLYLARHKISFTTCFHLTPGSHMQACLHNYVKVNISLK